MRLARTAADAGFCPVTRFRSSTMYGFHFSTLLMSTPTFSLSSVSSSYVDLEATPTASSSSLVKHVIL